MTSAYSFFLYKYISIMSIYLYKMSGIPFFFFLNKECKERTVKTQFVEMKIILCKSLSLKATTAPTIAQTYYKLE